MVYIFKPNVLPNINISFGLLLDVTKPAKQEIICNYMCIKKGMVNLFLLLQLLILALVPHQAESCWVFGGYLPY